TRTSSGKPRLKSNRQARRASARRPAARRAHSISGSSFRDAWTAASTRSGGRARAPRSVAIRRLPQQRARSERASSRAYASSPTVPSWRQRATVAAAVARWYPRATRRSSSSASVRGARVSIRAATSSGVGSGRRRPLPLEAVDFDRLLCRVPVLPVEVVPAGIAGRRDAAGLQGEVVRVGRLSEGLVEGDEPLAPEGHEGLVERLHAVAHVAARDRVADLARPLRRLHTLLDEPGRHHDLDGGDHAGTIGAW